MEDFKLGAMNHQATSSDSTSKFTIPALKPKTSGFKLNDGSMVLNGSSNINQFILKQLEQRSNNGQSAADRFNVPKLEKGKTPSMIGVTTNLQDIQELRHKQDEELVIEASREEDHIIDLTTALSSTRIGVSSANQRKKTQSEVFEIPFIDCDRKQQLPQTDNYCLIDISHIRFQHNLAQPSTLGRILSSKAKRNHISGLPAQKTEFKAKHRVDRFSFDTKSPDDVVHASLNRFTRAQ